MKKLIANLFLVLAAVLFLLCSKPILVQEICFNFKFGADSLDPGEEFEFYGPVGLEGAGFINYSDEPQTERTLCFDAIHNPETVMALVEADFYSFGASKGTVDIESVEISFGRLE